MVEKRNASRSNRRRNSQAGAASDQRARSDTVKKRVAAIRADGPASYEIDEHGKCNCKDISPTCVCDLCPDDRRAEGLTAARELDYKFHAATNVVMDMEHDEKTQKSLCSTALNPSTHESVSELHFRKKRNLSNPCDEPFICLFNKFLRLLRRRVCQLETKRTQLL